MKYAYFYSYSFKNSNIKTHESHLRLFHLFSKIILNRFFNFYSYVAESNKK